jgi:hypothetical protein
LALPPRRSYHEQFLVSRVGPKSLEIRTMNGSSFTCIIAYLLVSSPLPRVLNLIRETESLRNLVNIYQCYNQLKLSLLTELGDQYFSELLCILCK